MNEFQQGLKVFLCHASENKPVVHELYERLMSDGFDPWLDSENLLPGMDWDMEIKQAMRKSDAVIVCLSKILVEKEGHVQKEIKHALEIQKEKPEGMIFLLPIELEKCDIPFSLQNVQWGRYYEPDGYVKIVEALTLKANKLGRVIRKISEPTVALPIGSYIPFPRNAIFTGREKEMDGLVSSLLGAKPSATLISQAITGMGGIGKTQLAVEFGYRYGYRFKGVHWLDLRDPSMLDGEIAKNGSLMSLRPWSEKEPEQVQQTLRAWQMDGPRLLILDNFEDIGKIYEILKKFQHPSFRVLITSRHKDFPKTIGLQIQELDIFSEQEGLDFLAKTLEGSKTKEARLQLSERLGGLPLAMELAAHYININAITISAYLKELDDLLAHESMQAEWFKALEILNPTEHDQSLLATFELSWKQVKDEIQQQIFTLSGYCAPNTPIPLEIFQIALDLDDKSINKSLYRLNALGLLRSHNNLPTIHPLLAAYARKIDKDKVLLKPLAEKFGEYAREKTEKKLWNKIAGIYPHLSLVAKSAESENFAITGLLWDVCARYLTNVANFQEAKATIEHALKSDQDHFGFHHPDVARDLIDLSNVLRNLGDYVNAKIACERALWIRETAFKVDYLNVAVTLNGLGMVLRDLGDYAGAKAAHERALQISETVLDADVATTLNNLGGVLHDLGDYAGAKAAYERALRIDETALGTHHPDVATTLNNLGGVLRDLGDYAGAKAVYERSLRIDESALGVDHPYVATTLNNLGMVLRDLRDYAGAKAAHERALLITEIVLGTDHPNMAGGLNGLGMVLRDLGDYVGAKTAYERALRIIETVLGTDHPNVAPTLNNLGMVLRDLGDYAGAKATLERALPIYIKAKGKLHAETAEILNNLAAVTADLGNYSLATNYFKQAVNIMQQTLPRNHPLRRQAEMNLQALLRFSRSSMAFQQNKHRKH